MLAVRDHTSTYVYIRLDYVCIRKHAAYAMGCTDLPRSGLLLEGLSRCEIELLMFNLELEDVSLKSPEFWGVLIG